MVKPNIRGINKRSLRFTLAGWRNLENDSLIQHSYPWRKSWVEQVETDGSVSPLVARSGRVFILRNGPSSKDFIRTRSKSQLTNLNPKFVFLGVSIILASTFVLSFSKAESSGTRASNLEQNLQASAAEPMNCESLFSDPEVQIQDWLNGKQLNAVRVLEKSRLKFGGVELSRVTLTCDQQQQDFQLTIAFDKGGWLLKKFSRLDN